MVFDEDKTEKKALVEHITKIEEVVVEQDENSVDNEPIIKEEKDVENISIDEVLKMSEDERRKLIEKQTYSTGIIFKSKEDRIQNSFFYPIEQEKINMTVRYHNWEFLVINGNIEDPLYDEKKYVKEDICFYCEYLFSHDKGDVYAVWYPGLSGSESINLEENAEENFKPAIVGIFFVTEKEIINVRNLNVNGEPASVFELDEEKMLSTDYGFPVCAMDFQNQIETNLSGEEYWKVWIYQDNNYVVADIRTEDGYYEAYVWKKDTGLVGYQYGQNIGGNQHDFFVDEYVLENFLYRGWE